jgi:hypothetical protein
MPESRTSRSSSRAESDVQPARARDRAPDFSGCQSGCRNQFAKLARIDSNGASTAKGSEPTLCPSLNISVRNAITGSKRSSSVNSGRNARSATRPGLTLSSQCLRFRLRARRAAWRRPAARAVRAAIRAVLALAPLAIWIEEPTGPRARRCKLAGCASRFSVRLPAAASRSGIVCA